MNYYNIYTILILYQIFSLNAFLMGIDLFLHLIIAYQLNNLQFILYFVLILLFFLYQTNLHRVSYFTNLY